MKTDAKNLVKAIPLMSDAARESERIRPTFDASIASKEATSTETAIPGRPGARNSVGMIGGTNECIHVLIQERAEQTPDAPAVEFDGQRLTYGSINARANQMAHHLLNRNLEQETLVGLCLDRSPAMVVALLGVLKAGCAYLPLDPTHPRARRQAVLADSQAPLLLTEARWASDFGGSSAQVLCIDTMFDSLESESTENPTTDASADQLAYVIYTSGSTGRPKGVEVTHRSVTNCLRSLTTSLGTNSEDVFLAVTTIAFDIAAVELLFPLLLGAKTVIIDRAAATNGALLMERLVTSAATVMQGTPSTWKLLLAAGWRGDRRLKLLCCGEALHRNLADQLLPRGAALWNLYGPTETTIFSSLHRVAEAVPADGETTVPIGSPIANTQMYILGSDGTPVPPGATGELYIGGLGLARGYRRCPDLTIAHFVPNHLGEDEGERLYKTGDLARRRPDGLLEYLGRVDQQVKIRGYRVEPAEVEATLMEHPGVGSAAVLVGQDSVGGSRLLAYVVPASRISGQTSEDGPEGRIAEWQRVYSDIYRRGGPSADPSLNTAGWKSSYTGQPLPEAEMKEWVDHTVSRILALRPQRVLEIGCGTGMLLFRIAPSCSHYRAVDVSREALDYVARQMDAFDSESWHVDLLQRAAHAFDDSERESYDLVVINSVTQHFPSLGYLIDVLEKCVRAVRPGGAIFIGDIRSLPLLRVFHASVQLYKAASSDSREQLRQRVEQQVLQEDQLLLDPGLFRALQARWPEIARVRLQLKGGRYPNEMTRFRYDVTLFIHGEGSPALDGGPTIDWIEGSSDLREVACALEQDRPPYLSLRGVTNRRLWGDLRTAEWLAGRTGQEARTAGEWKQLLPAAPQGGIDFQDLSDTGDEFGYEVECLRSTFGAEPRLDVVFQRKALVARPSRSLGRGDELAHQAPGEQSWERFANDPFRGAGARQLLPALRGFLATRLPEHMIPSTFALVDALPLNHNGKVDRTALCAPSDLRQQLSVEYTPPRREIEKRIMTVWQDVLQISRIGIFDNFFDLGGNSLLAGETLARLQRSHMGQLSIVDLFDHPTVHSIAKHLERIRSDQPAIAGAHGLMTQRKQLRSSVRDRRTSVSSGSRSLQSKKGESE